MAVRAGPLRRMMRLDFNAFEMVSAVDPHGTMDCDEDKRVGAGHCWSRNEAL